MQPGTAESTSAAVVLVFLTTLAVILGELVPKSLALQNPTSTALFTILPMQWSMKAFSWSIAFLNGSGVRLLKLLGVPSTGHRHVHSPEEIALLIAESRDGGFLEPQEQVRLHRALRLGLRTARQLMVPRARLAAIDADLPFDEVLRVVAASPYSRLPVYRGSIDAIVGILHIKDVVTRYVQAGTLLGTYTTEGEIDLARTRAVSTIDAQVQSSTAYVATLSKRKLELESKKAALGSKPVPQVLERELANITTELGKQSELIAVKQKEIMTVTARYDADKRRWKELRTAAEADTPTSGASKVVPTTARQ